MKEYGIPVVRILNQWQVVLYLTNGLKPIDIYASKNEIGDYKIIYVFERNGSSELFEKFRKHELEVGSNYFSVK